MSLDRHVFQKLVSESVTFPRLYVVLLSPTLWKTAPVHALVLSCLSHS